MLIFAAIFCIVGRILEIRSQHKRLQCTYDAARKSNTTLHQVIEDTLAMEFSKIDPDDVDKYGRALIPVIESEMYYKDTGSKSRFIIWSATKIICSTVFSICFLWFALHNLEIYMDAALLESDTLNISTFSLELIEHWWLVLIGAIAVIFEKALTFGINKNSDNDRRAWISKEYSHKLEIYDTYMDCFYGVRKVVEESQQNNKDNGR